MESIRVQAQANMEALKNSDYPGRGIVTGMTPSGTHVVQIYWTMGRSANSKNRILVKEGDRVKTRPRDLSLEIQREELIIYDAAMQAGGAHIVSNGRQTNTVAEYIAKGDSFENALYGWSFEDDPPIYTSRITGVVSATGGYKLSILKALEQNPALLSRQFFAYAMPEQGYGHCIHTYSLTETCKPFQGEPYRVALQEDMEANARLYWGLLAADKRVGLYIKQISVADGRFADLVVSQ